MADDKKSTLAYTSSFCQSEVNRYIYELTNLATKLQNEYDNMDFENAKEYLKMEEHLDDMLSKIAKIKLDISDVSFE